MADKHRLLNPAQVSSDEPLSRYLPQSGHFSRQQSRVKPRAFLPEPSGLTTSVFRTYALSETEIWEIADVYMSGPTGRSVHGRADLLVSHVEATGLRVNPDNVPERHADIVGWPQRKDEQLALAQELAAVALLKLRAPLPSG